MSPAFPPPLHHLRVSAALLLDFVASVSTVSAMSPHHPLPCPPPLLKTYPLLSLPHSLCPCFHRLYTQRATAVVASTDSAFTAEATTLLAANSVQTNRQPEQLAHPPTILLLYERQSLSPIIILLPHCQRHPSQPLSPTLLLSHRHQH